MAIDFACKMSSDPATAATRLDCEMTTEHFRSAGCRDYFAPTGEPTFPRLFVWSASAK